MQALINIRHNDRIYQAMSLGLEPKDFPDAFRRCALAFIGTAGGIKAMKGLGKKSLSFGEAFGAMPQDLCVLYGFLPIRGGIPEVGMDCCMDGPVADLSECVPDKNLIDAACSFAADGPQEAYEKIMGALRIPDAYCGDRGQRAWQLMRAIDAYGSAMHPHSGTLPHSAYLAMAEVLYDNAEKIQAEEDREG